MNDDENPYDGQYRARKFDRKGSGIILEAAARLGKAVVQLSLPSEVLQTRSDTWVENCMGRVIFLYKWACRFYILENVEHIISMDHDITTEVMQYQTGLNLEILSLWLEAKISQIGVGEREGNTRTEIQKPNFSNVNLILQSFVCLQLS